MIEAASLFILSGITFLVPQLRALYFRKDLDEKSQPNTLSNIPYFDFLRGISIIAVIIIHVIYFYKDSLLLPNLNTLLVFSLNNILRFAIPFFLITSGILLTPFPYTRKNYKHFLLKKSLKLLPPYLLCCIFIAFYHHYPLVKSIQLTLTGFMAVPYYFICILFQAYFFYPLLLKYVEKKYFLQFMFLLSILCYCIPQTWLIWGFPFVGRYLFFFAYGIKMRNYFLFKKLEKKESPFWLSLILFYLTLAIAFPAYYYNVRLIYGIALFNICMILQPYINLKHKLNKILIAFGKNSLFIFLTHFGLISFLFTLLKNVSHLPLIHAVLIIVLCIPGSFLLAIIFKKTYQKFFFLFTPKNLP